MTQLAQALEELTGDVQIGQDFLFTAIGGIAIRMINKTGAASVKGMTVEANTALDESFVIADADGNHHIGVVYEAGIADGSLCWVVIHGWADALLKNATAATHGNWVTISDVAGRIDATQAAPPAGGIAQLDNHMKEIGHCLETVVGGVDKTARVHLHWN